MEEGKNTKGKDKGWKVEKHWAKTLMRRSVSLLCEFGNCLCPETWWYLLLRSQHAASVGAINFMYMKI